MKSIYPTSIAAALLTASSFLPAHAAPGWIPHQGRLVLSGTNYHGVGYTKFAMVDEGQVVSRLAAARAIVVGGQVTSIQILDPGSGYTEAPRVAFFDARGRGATAEAFISKGEVVDIRVLTPGSGYGPGVRVILGSPPIQIQHTTYWSHDGTSVDGSEPTGSVPLEFEQGLYFVPLGEVSGGFMTSALTPDIFSDHDDIRLRIWFSPSNTPGSFVQLVPDQALGSVGHALTADQAATVAAGAITAEHIADGAITAEKISAPGTERIPVSDGNGGIAWMRVGDFLLAQNYHPPLPGIVENEAVLEASGVFVDVVQVVNGPGIEIERVPSTFTESGLNTEFALVFDYAGPDTNDLKQWFDQVQASSIAPLSGSINVPRSDGSESFRWTFLEYELTGIGYGQGGGGKNRYTLTHALHPDRLMGIDMETAWPAEINNNPETDLQVDINGILSGVYPVVEDDASSKTLTLTYDFNEAGNIWAWVKQFATEGTAVHTRGSVEVIFARNDGFEIGRNVYFECFPIRYQHFTGFGQDTKAKARVVLNYDNSENAAGAGLPLYVPPPVEYFPGTNNIEVPYDAAQNRVVMEIGGFFSTTPSTPPSELPVLLSGPGIELERIPGFDGMGNPEDHAGLNREMPLIFELGLPHLADIQTWKNTYDADLPTDADLNSGSLIVLNGASAEVYRWNFFEVAPFAIEPQPSGRSRVTVLVAGSPDNTVFYRYDGLDWGDSLQNNPTTDTRVEISGNTTMYAEVEVDAAERTVSLTYDFGEGGQIYPWVRNTAEQGTATANKLSMTIHFSSPTNYFGVFPVRFQHFTGFEQDIKGKAKVVLSYDTAAPAQ